MVLLLRKLNLYFTKDTEAVHYFPEGGGPTFSVLVIFQGGVRTPIRLWIRAWAISS